MKKTVCLVLGALAVGSVQAEPLRAETLEDVLATVYASNPTLQARRAKLRSTDETVPQAVAKWRPTVKMTAEAGRGRYESNSSTISREQGRNPETHTLTVTQPLYRGGRTVAATAQAEASVIADRAELHKTEQTVLLSAATAFLNVVRDEEVVKLNINNEQVLRRQYEATMDRFRVGEVTRTDVSQAEARLAGATADRVQAEGTLQASRANFLNYVGRPPETPQPPKAAAAVPASLDEAKSLAAERNPAVVSADYTHRAAKDGIDLVAGELLPEVNLVGEYSRALDASAHGTETETLEAMLSVSVPIYQQGAVFSRLRASKHTAAQRRVEVDQARRDALESATKAWEELFAARARMKQYETQIKASELALAGVEEEAKVGSRTVLDVLDAEQEVFNARVNLVKARRDDFVQALTLRAAVGQLTAGDLGLPVDRYDPVKHYEEVRGRWFGGGVEEPLGYE